MLCLEAVNQHTGMVFSQCRVIVHAGDLQEHLLCSGCYFVVEANFKEVNVLVN